MLCSLLTYESCVGLERKERGGDLLSRKERTLIETECGRATFMKVSREIGHATFI